MKWVRWRAFRGNLGFSSEEAGGSLKNSAFLEKKTNSGGQESRREARRKQRSSMNRGQATQKGPQNKAEGGERDGGTGGLSSNHRAWLRKHERKAGISRGGRGNTGRITVRHRGGGHKRKLRRIRSKLPGGSAVGNQDARILGEVYDPGRSGRVFVVEPVDGGKPRFVLGVAGRKPGDRRRWWPAGESEGGSGRTVPPRGTRRPLRKVPAGVPRHNLATSTGGEGVRVRAAGRSARLVSRAGDRVRVRLPSGEERLLPGDGRATLGVVGGASRASLRPGVRGAGKAGRSRWRGRRPTVRGVARNPVDHPHGGGEGKASGGRPSVTPWSRPQRVRTTSGRSKRYVVVARTRGSQAGGGR